MRYYIFLLSFYSSIFTNPYADEVYSQIQDLTNPTEIEYSAIQAYITSGNIPHIDRIVDWKKEPYQRDFVIYAAESDIVHEIIQVNVKEKDRNNCIVLYASFNGPYAEELYTLVETIENSKYKGHIIYRIGGFPNLDGGDIVRSHIPNAFKASSIKEAKDLGFQRVLWIDTDMIPVKSLNKLFKKIKKYGTYTYQTPYSLRAMCFRGEHITAFNLTREQALGMYTVHSSVLGFNFQDEVATAFFEDWYENTIENEDSSMTAHLDHCFISWKANQYYGKGYFPMMMEYVNTDDKDTEFTND